MANANLQLKNYSRSEKQFLQALELSKANQFNEETFTICIGLSELYLAQSNLKLAEAYALEALGLADKSGSLEYIADANKALYLITKKASRFSESIAYMEVYQLYRDSLQTIDKVEIIADLETKYQTAQKEQEIATQKLEITAKESAIKSQRFQIYGLISGLVILLLAGFIFYNQYKNQQKQKLQAASCHFARKRTWL